LKNVLKILQLNEKTYKKITSTEWKNV